jgi:predicted ATP-dependent endonuclease of OLD family
MIIKSAKVQNYRCIQDEKLHCEQLTALVGPNGCGKSSFLKAIELFYSSKPHLDKEDFYNRDTNLEIIIGITFYNLSEKAKDRFSKYIQGDTLTVERVFIWNEGKIEWHYHGSSLQNPDFKELRDAFDITDRAVTAKQRYGELQKKSKYSSLQAWSNKDGVKDGLALWEGENPSECERKRDNGKFFGFQGVGKGYLGMFTEFLLIPAVRDASDDTTDARGSVLSNLMEKVVRNAIANNEDIKQLIDDTQKKYEDILDPSKIKELQTLGSDLTNTLQTYVPDSCIKLSWMPFEGLKIPSPIANVDIEEDGFFSTVEKKGHGLQRAFILTLLQHLALANRETSKSEEEPVESSDEGLLPNLVLAIEEPELYQHPNRQRHLSNVLLKLAEGKTPGVAEQTQIIYTTHSPLFVDIKRFDKVRVLHKVLQVEGKPKETKVIHTNLDEIAEIIEKADGKPKGTYSGKTLEPRLQTLMTPWMNEGFFSEVIVLVEGEEDRAAILGIANALGHDLVSKGISVIPCMGKNNLDRPTAIFSKLQIPIYVIWDSDYGGQDVQPEDNRKLLRLFDGKIEDWPEIVDDKFACFKTKMHDTLKSEIGVAFYDENVKTLCNDFCLKKKQAIKNPQIIQKIIEHAREQQNTSPTLESIVSKILNLQSKKE